MEKFKRGGIILLILGLPFIIAAELHFLENGAKKLPGKDSFTLYTEMTDAAFSDMQCFPIVKENADGTYPVSYENTWGSGTQLWGKTEA